MAKGSKKSQHKKKKLSEEYIDSDNSEEAISDNEETKREKNRLKKDVLLWIECDDKIRNINDKMKDLKTKKKDCEKKIIERIANLNIVNDTTFETDKGNVYKKTVVSKGAINTNVIKEALKGYIKKEKHVEQLIKKIDQMRPIKQRVYITRSKEKKSGESKTDK